MKAGRHGEADDGAGQERVEDSDVSPLNGIEHIDHFKVRDWRENQERYCAQQVRPDVNYNITQRETVSKY